MGKWGVRAEGFLGGVLMVRVALVAIVVGGFEGQQRQGWEGRREEGEEERERGALSLQNENPFRRRVSENQN